MTKRRSANLDAPIWFDGTNINEALFCDEFLNSRKIIFANGAFFTPDGRVTDDLPLRGEIYEELKCCAVNNIPRKITNILEVMKLAAHVEDFAPEADRIHLANGTLKLDGSFTEGRPNIVRSRLPVAYRPDAPAPVRWLSFLDGLLYTEDIPTLQEFIGYMHLSFVPLTADGRLCAKEIVGNKKKLTQWQDRFWEHMVKKYPDLERGESAGETGRDHIPPRVFKEMTRLTKQKAKLEELLSGVNAFNAKGKAAEIGAFLDKYIPAVEQMHTTLKKYNTAFTATTAENKKLKKRTEQLEQSLDKATQGSTLKKLADAKLHRDYEDAVAVLDRIPKEVLAAYTHRTEKERETAYGR